MGVLGRQAMTAGEHANDTNTLNWRDEEDQAEMLESLFRHKKTSHAKVGGLVYLSPRNVNASAAFTRDAAEPTPVHALMRKNPKQRQTPRHGLVIAGAHPRSPLAASMASSLGSSADAWTYCQSEDTWHIHSIIYTHIFAYRTSLLALELTSAAPAKGALNATQQ